jgi:predicted nucleic acid-binding Zn ribbon protein
MTQAPTTPPRGTDASCPTCGSPVERGQLVCLTCGGRVGLQYRRPPRWQVPVFLASAVIVLAAAGVFAALQLAGDEGREEVAAGPASRQEAAEQPKPGEDDSGEPRLGETTTDPSPQADRTQSEREPAGPASGAGLNQAKRTPLAVLSGVPQPGAAARFAKRLERRGFRVKTVANAPGPAERSSVLYVGGGEKAARALAEDAGIEDVKAADPATAAAAQGAKLVVVLGASS